MRVHFSGTALLTTALWFSSGCASCDNTVINDNPQSDGGNGDAGSGNVLDSGFVYDGGLLADGGVVDPFNPENETLDSDCDGLSDAEEFATVFGGGSRTDPAQNDTDGDGLADGLERGKVTSTDPACGAIATDLNPATQTLPTEADSDNDGLSDGVEDTNKNGRVDAGETSPQDPDSDGDGLLDGAEDLNANGQLDTGETSPLLKDTDLDKINDAVERNITLTDPAKADTDGDSCKDGDEDTNQNGMVDQGETHPKLSTDCGPQNVLDTDLDGLPDSVEDKNGNGLFEPQLGETNKSVTDTDGDGLSDGLEDRNKNGFLEVGETNPRRVDSDCDGLTDGPNQGLRKGEDLNANGTVDPSETDPLDADTDGDGLRDGLERSVTANPDATNCPIFVADADPATTSNANNRDTDGDGIDDGAEDANQNGRFDAGELDPANPNDGTGPAGQACNTNNIRPVLFEAESLPDIRLGLPATFTEVSSIVLGGQARGLIGYDATNKVAFVAFRQGAPAGATTPAQDEAALRTQVAQAGALSNITTQSFTTWDNVAALQAYYEQADLGDLKSQVNTLANQLVGAGAGSLAGNAGVGGPFQLQMQVVHRSQQSMLVVLAIMPRSLFTEPGIFSMGDVAGGSALAQFGDSTALQCETFAPTTPKVDFLFVVDDSCSMDVYQQRLADTATAVAANLNNSALDWRIALVTTEYHSSNIGNGGILRGFTRNIHQFRTWLTQGSTCSSGTCSIVAPATACDSNGAAADGQNGGCWVGAGNNNTSGREGMLGAGRKAVYDLSPASALEVSGKFRQDANVVVIMVGDADDQTIGYTTTNDACVNQGTCEPISRFISFFNNTGTVLQQDLNPLNKPIAVHGIVCADGVLCGETQANPRRNAAVFTATGGVRGNLESATSISSSFTTIINATIGASGHQMRKPPLGASVKVAMSDVENGALCNKVDLPRSRVNGFDFDGLNRTLSFFGACRPPSALVATAAVSYRYWVDNTPDPNGTPPPCANDPFYDSTDPDFCRGKLECNTGTNVCECPANCGGVAPPGKVCNANKQVCDFVCTPDCGGTCGGYSTCNTVSCTCECLPNATCAAGYTFKNSGGVCGCVCDTQALSCGASYQADANSCACLCKPQCGGCGAGLTCNMSTCSCSGGLQ